MPRYHNRSVSRWAVLLSGFGLLTLLGGCNNDPPRIKGFVMEDKGTIVESFCTRSPRGWVEREDAVRLPSATLSVVVPNPGGELTVITIQSGPDGSFLLELPQDLPKGTVLRVSAVDHEPYVYRLDEKPPAYIELGFVLKKKQKA